MTLKILLAIGLALIFLIPSILLIEGAQKELTEIDKKVVTLKLNLLHTLFLGFISSLLTASGILLLYTLIDFSEGPFLFKVLLFGVANVLIIDLPLYLNHINQIKGQTLIWDKENNKVLMSKAGKEISIDLENDQYEVIRYEPKWPGTSIGRPPGLDLGKIVIQKGNSRIEISDLLLKEYNLFSVLNENENRNLIFRYFNFIK